MWTIAVIPHLFRQHCSYKTLPLRISQQYLDMFSLEVDVWIWVTNEMLRWVMNSKTVVVWIKYVTKSFSSLSLSLTLHLVSLDALKSLTPAGFSYCPSGTPFWPLSPKRTAVQDSWIPFLHNIVPRPWTQHSPSSVNPDEGKEWWLHCQKEFLKYSIRYSDFLSKAASSSSRDLLDQRPHPRRWRRLNASYESYFEIHHHPFRWTAISLPTAPIVKSSEANLGCMDEYVIGLKRGWRRRAFLTSAQCNDLSPCLFFRSTNPFTSHRSPVTTLPHPSLDS